MIERDVYWDKLKGIAILAVIIVHSTAMTENFPQGSFNNEFGIWLRQLVNFPVALFLFISGYFLGFSEGVPFLKMVNRFKRLLLPFLFWSAVFFVAMERWKDWQPVEWVISLGNGGSTIVGYFVLVILQLTFISPLLFRIRKQAWFAFFILISLMVSFSFTYMISIVFQESTLSRFPYYALPFFVWLPAYALGFYISRFKLQVSEKKSLILFGIFVLFIVLSFVEAAYLAEQNRSLAISQLKVTSFTASLALAGLAFHKQRWLNLAIPVRFFAWFGKSSYFIYLSHMLILLAVTQLLKEISWIYEHQPFFILASVTLVVGAEALMVICLTRIVPKRFQQDALGL